MGNCLSWCELLTRFDSQNALRRTLSFHIHGVLSQIHSRKHEPGKSGKCSRLSNNKECITVLDRKTENLNLHFELGRELGRGQFGLIRLCTHRQTGEQFACKSIQKSMLVTAEDVADVRREIRVMEKLADHPNIVQLKAVYEDEEWVHLLMELCEGGELFDCITKRRFSEEEAAQICKTLMKVLQYCHARGVIHRDLKPENILLARNHSLLPIKVADFGLAITARRGERFSGLAGSVYYIAPEILRGDYGEEIDVWSAGVILYILLSGVPPFWDDTEDGIFEAIQLGHLDLSSSPWPSMSSAVKDLLRGMLCPDVKRRTTPDEVLNHRWILRHCKNSSSQRPLTLHSESSYPCNTWPCGRTSPTGSSFSSEYEANSAETESSTEERSAPDIPVLESTSILKILDQNCAHESQRAEVVATEVPKYWIGIADSSNFPGPKGERWALLTGVVEPTLTELLINVITDIARLSLLSTATSSPFRNLETSSTYLLLETSRLKDAYLLDTLDRKFLIMHDKGRRKIGWKQIREYEEATKVIFCSGYPKSSSFTTFNLCKEVACY